MELLMFTKMLKNIGNLTLDQAGDYIVEMGFDGADLTVRPRGYVLPEEVTKRLPEAIDLLRSKGLTVPMITSSVTDSKEEYAEEIFKTASECGVKFIKLGYWVYKGFGKIKSQIERVREKLRGIASLSREYNITAAVHTHSGAYLSANPAMMLMLLQGHDPKHVCAYIDPGHMLSESGPSGWEMGIDLLSEYIRLVAVKNFRWLRVTDERTGKKRWEIRMFPLKEEVVPWPKFFGLLKKIDFDGPVSVHSEYERLNFEELIRQTKEDLKYLKWVLREV